MMEKVKITRKQATAIEEYKETVMGVFDFLHDLAGTHNLESHGEDQEEEAIRLMKAYSGGYEVEPECKVGELAKICDDDLERVREIQSIYGDVDDKTEYVNLYGADRVPMNMLIKLSPSEQAAEKERRWWANHGREPWEIREDDTLEYLGDLYVIDWFDSEKVCLKSGIERK